MCFNCIAQPDSLKKIKLYESWISSESGRSIPSGILFEIKDSSVLFSLPVTKQEYRTGNIRINEIPYSNLDFIRIRRSNNIKRSGIIGSIIGFTIPAIAIYSDRETAKDWGPVLLLGAAVPFSCLGYGIGALVGSSKKTYAINRDFEHFKANRSGLSRYSYITENIIYEKSSQPKTEHRCFIGFLDGPSIPVFKFGDSSTGNKDSGFAKTGYFSCIPYLGIRLSDLYGISAMMFYSQYDVSNEPGSWYGIGGLLGGAIVTLAKSGKFIFDLKPSAGFSSAQYLTGDDLLKYGNGVSFAISTSAQYNITQRLCLFGAPAYFFTRQKFNDNSRLSVSTVNLSLGLGYRFR